MLQGCGTVLPETGLTSLGRIAAGGDKILIEVPEDVWEKPSMPKFAVTGMQAGGAMGTFNLSWAVLLGATLPRPEGALAGLVHRSDGRGRRRRRQAGLHRRPPQRRRLRPAAHLRSASAARRPRRSSCFWSRGTW